MSLWKRIGGGAWRYGVLLLLLLSLAGCGGAPSPTPTPVAVTVETGGMAVTAAPATPAATPTPLPEPTAAPRLAPGATVSALATLRVYADADPAAPVLAEYAAGAAFTVLEPGGDYAAYPVVVAGIPWYRVRAEDGLAGWVMGDRVAAAG